MKTPGSPYRYTLFGLALDSAIDLPDLAASDAQATAEITIELGESPPPAIAPGVLDAVEGGVRFLIDGVACFTVLGGRRIVCQPVPGADPRNVRLYLLGSAIGMLLHQRGLLPLHATAVEIDGRAFAFMGHSGAGKSTLAAWLHDRGFALLADDVCVVTVDAGGGPVAWPGLSRIRLWRGALEATGRDPADFDPSFVGDPDHDKFDVPFADRLRGGQPVPLSAIYLLGTGDALGFSRLEGVEGVEALFANTYRGGFLPWTDRSTGHWRACVALARAVPLFRLAREWGGARFDEQALGIVAHARGLL